jgi:hypothetical protein
VLQDALARRQFASATDYADTAPCARLDTLASHLEVPDVQGDHLRWLLWEEAAHAGTVARRARDQLARDLYNDLRDGWGQGLYARKGYVFDQWRRQLPRNLQFAAAPVRDAMLDAPLPTGWRPSGADDPDLMEIFVSYWPATASLRGAITLELGYGILIHGTEPPR